MSQREWQNCASVTRGGKPEFYIRKVVDYGPENWGYYRVVWDRTQCKWKATKDQKHGDNPTVIGYFDSARHAKIACENHERDPLSRSSAAR